jgi:SAM-dependent methyltransferase
MNLDGLQRLLSDEGQLALRRIAELAPTAATWLRDIERLRREFSPDLAQAACQMYQLRVAARQKFRQADRMYFTRDALEQSTGEIVARHRARRFRGFSPIADLCCGVGGDTLALAEQAEVQAVDIDPLRLAMARANVEAVRPSHPVQFHQADVIAWQPGEMPAAFIDPDRRATGQRQVRLSDYRPPWSAIMDRWGRTTAWAMKVAPAVPWDDLDRLDAEVEFVSLRGELKEGVLWFGEFRSTRRRATTLPTGATLASEEAPNCPIGPIGSFVHDPDPSVTRAGLVSELAKLLDAHQLDPQVAFLSGEKPSKSPLARSYRIEAVLPFAAQRLREFLRIRRVGQVSWLKRGHAADVAFLARQLKLAGDEHRTIILTRLGGEPKAIVAVGVAPEESADV